MKTILSLLALGSTLAFSQFAQAGDDHRSSNRLLLDAPTISINIEFPSAYAALGFDGYRNDRVWDDDDDDDDNDNDDDDDDDDDDD